MRKINLLNFLLPTTILLSVLIFLWLGKGGVSRFSQVAFYNDPSVQNEQTKMFYEEGQDNTIVARTFHNKIITYTRGLLKNYGDYVELNFLFLNAGKPPRYSPPAVGLLYLFELPFLIYGISTLIQTKTRPAWLVILLLLVSPIVAAITAEYSPNVQRSFFMVPYLELVVAYGIYVARKNLSSITARIAIITTVVICMTYYLHQYYVHFPVHDPLYRNDGEIALVQTIMPLTVGYSKIVITSSPEPPYHYFLFFTKFDPETFQKKYITVKYGDGWLFEDKIFFSHESCPAEKLYEGPQAHVLYVDDGQCRFDSRESGKFRLIKNITRSDGSILYRLIEPRSVSPRAADQDLQ